MKFEIQIQVADETIFFLMNHNFDAGRLEVLGAQALDGKRLRQLPYMSAARIALNNWSKIVEACKTS